jgi:adenine-specific DNA-methyltransferase
MTMFPDLQPFATPKPEGLLERIVHIASDPDDLVLDFFAGSATTAAVSHKMGRRWIAIERSLATVAKYALPRLAKVVNGQDGGGISEQVGWDGGGSFSVYETPGFSRTSKSVRTKLPLLIKENARRQPASQVVA